MLHRAEKVPADADKQDAKQRGPQQHGDAGRDAARKRTVVAWSDRQTSWASLSLLIFISRFSVKGLITSHLDA